ncbi:MAG: NAD-dependent succinate-semialdehyde dehydrogenase [Phycisphaeraceae bacterium]
MAPQAVTGIESPLLKHLSGYIGGQWVGADSGETTDVVNPATGDRLAAVPSMGEAETRRAIDAAHAALDQPASIDERREWLLRIDAALRKHKDEIARILTMEMGKPLKEARGEAEYAAGFYRYCADNIDLLKPRPVTERPKGMDWTVHHRPAGVVALLTPWNFPMAMIAKKLSAALAADSPSIIKPSSKTPLSMIVLFHILEQEAKLPPGKANLLLGHPKTIADVLCEDERVRVISLTGSTEVGKLLVQKTAHDLKRLCLELGGNAPFIVFEDADLDHAADQLVANKFRANGQTCVCANRVYAHESIADAFAEKVAERASKLKVGDGMADDTDLGPLIDRAGYDKVRRHVEDALAKGAEIVTGSDVPEPLGDDWGCFHPPTVLRNVTHEMVCCREETFGPLVPILKFDNEAEAVAFGNRTEYGLASYVFTADDDRAARVAAQLRFGHVGHNTGQGPTPEAPFGGMKQSGYGREGGIEGLFEFTEAQTIPHG